MAHQITLLSEMKRETKTTTPIHSSFKEVVSNLTEVHS
jgi:hypothetical protein